MTWRKARFGFSDKILAMIVLLRHLLGWMVSAFRSREDLVLENLSLRQQLLALHVQRPRHRLTALHKLFWVALRTCWSGWRKPLDHRLNGFAIVPEKRQPSLHRMWIFRSSADPSRRCRPFSES